MKKPLLNIAGGCNADEIEKGLSLGA